MDNKQVREISFEEVQSQLSKEELQQTQVLNLQEVQKTIRFEKITSKKPALLVAIFGVALLIFGGSLQITSIMNSKKIEKRDVGKDLVQEHNKTKTLSCVKTTVNNPDGTDVTYSIKYEFKNNKLINTKKVYNKNAISGNTTGTATIKSLIQEYQTLLNQSDGYSVSFTNNDDNSIKVEVEIDYENFDLTKLNEKQQTKEITKVEYQRTDTYATVTGNMMEKGFTCE